MNDARYQLTIKKTDFKLSKDIPMRGTCETVNESAQCLFCMLIPRGLFKSSRGFIGNMAVQYLTSTLLLLNH